MALTGLVQNYQRDFGGLNVLVLATWGNKLKYGYWHSAMLGFTQLAKELGVFLFLNITEKAPGTLPRIPFEGRWCSSSSSRGLVPGRGEVEEERSSAESSVPFVFGYLYSMRPASDEKGMARDIPRHRPALVDGYRHINDVLWRNSVRTAVRLWRGSRATSGSSSPSRWDLMAELVKKAAAFPDEDLDKIVEPPDAEHALFLVRRGRSITNIDALRRFYNQNEIFHRTGTRWRVHFVLLERLSFPDEQRALVSLAGALLGVSGAGFVHQWWLPPGARVVHML